MSERAYLLGTDEAGYGPNLGPLVVSVCLWRASGDPRQVDLYERLQDAVVATPESRATAGPSRMATAGTCRVAIADSKKLHARPGGLALLERGVLASLAAASAEPGKSIRTWREIWATLAPGSNEEFESRPWYREFDPPLPIHQAPEEIAEAAENLRATMEAADCRLVAIKSVALFPEAFNDWNDRHATKGQVLSLLTLRLASEALDSIEGDALLLCDKHGGRNRYADLLMGELNTGLLSTSVESAAESAYAWTGSRGRREVRFLAKAERFLPVALASMTSKYLRELAMAPFNQFWMNRVAGLRPTAGYPEDAVRFKREIAVAQLESRIPDRALWRNK